MRRVALLVSIVALLSLGLAAPVLAAAPSNDLYPDRTVISLPFSDTVDTTGATTDANDAEANLDCGAPATDASVWYAFTATSDGALVVDVSSSDYSAGIIVATGTPGGFGLVTCSEGSVVFSVTSSKTYLILAFDDQYDGSGNGGTLANTVADAPPPPTLDVTVSSSGGFNAKTGVATIRGTVTCTGGDEFGKNFVSVQATQTVGRMKFTGWGGAEFTCDGTTQTWAADIFSDTGKFAGGKAVVWVDAFSCNLGGCTDVPLQATVTLRKGK